MTPQSAHCCRIGTRDSMIVLDKSRIPDNRLEDPRLIAEGKNCCEALQDPRYRLQVCVHEAAHGIYLRRAGATELIYHGPVAYYDAAIDEFDIGSAGILGKFPAEGVNMSAPELARWLAAGGVAKCLLTDASDGGDGRDFEEFTRMCEGYGDQAIQLEWEAAKKDIEKDLRSPAFRREVWKLAREFEKWLLEERNT